MGKTSPTQRSLQYLRGGAWRVAVVEKWNPHARIRQDLFGCGDLLAIKPGRRPLLVQATSASNVAARVTKIRELEHLPELLSVFGLEVHGWAKPTKTLRQWRLRVVTIRPDEVTDHGDFSG